jgi:hypothetical protein
MILRVQLHSGPLLAAIVIVTNGRLRDTSTSLLPEQ